MSDSLRPHGLQHARLPSPSPSPRVCTNSCPSSRWWCLFSYLAHAFLFSQLHFIIQVFTSPLLNIWFANTFFQFVVCLFIFLNGSFAEQMNFLKFLWSQVSFFYELHPWYYARVFPSGCTGEKNQPFFSSSHVFNTVRDAERYIDIEELCSRSF